MASKVHRGTRRQRRTRHVAKVVADSWLLVLASHTVATLVLMATERLLHVPWLGP